MMSTDENGTTAGEIAYNLPEWMAISAFTAIAWYNVLQLNVSIFLTFKRRRGLYFWSLLISGYGVIFHSVGFLLKLFEITTNEYLSITLITIGWWPMVTGQALVLYSRLHLVVKEEKILKGVLAMIIWNAITLHTPTTVLTYGSSSPDWQAFLPAFNIMERIQMTIFSLQELLISSIYLWAAFRLLKPVYRRRIRMVMLQLLWVNFIMVAMDVSILTMEYLGNYAVEATLKSMIYAIKLVLEFAVLNQLMRLANSSRTNYDMGAMGDSQRSKEPDDEEAQRVRRPSRIVPQRMSHFHIPYRHRPSLASSTNEPPRRLSSVARQGGEYPDSPPQLSTLLNRTSKDSNTRAGIPRLTLEEANVKSQGGSPSTVITNPAAFAPERPKPRDPLSLDGFTPVASPFDAPAPASPSSIFRDVPASYFEKPNERHLRPSRYRAHSSDTQHFDPVLTPAREVEEEGEDMLDPALLRPRRASVSDWAPDETDSAEIEAELDPIDPSSPPADEPVLKRLSGMSCRESGTVPPWLSGFATDKVAVSTPLKETPPASHPGGSGSEKGGLHPLEFVTKAI